MICSDDTDRDDPCEERPALRLQPEVTQQGTGGAIQDKGHQRGDREDRINRLVAMYFDAPPGVPRHIWPKLAKLLRLYLNGHGRGLSLRWCSRVLPVLHEWALSLKLYRDPPRLIEADLREAFWASRTNQMRPQLLLTQCHIVGQRPDLMEFREVAEKTFIDEMRQLGLQEGSPEELECLDLFQIVWAALSWQAGPNGTVSPRDAGPIIEEVDAQDIIFLDPPPPRRRRG